MADRPSLQRLIGVYDANGTVAGELAYVFRRAFAGGHCGLCDVTHGGLRERPEWRDAQQRLPVPFVAFHRNDQPDAIRAATTDEAPVVVAEFSDQRIERVEGPIEFPSSAATRMRSIASAGSGAVHRWITTAYDRHHGVASIPGAVRH